jgi:lipopolysaccharide transport system ATP-binding protein/teichoic acid transport system ATP-binding protein
VSSLSDFDIEDLNDGSTSDLLRVKKEITDDLAISVQKLSITYRTQFERVPTVKKAVANFIRREKREFKIVEAVKDVSFDVKHGTVLGVIGHNGAGKSTLLRSVAGILAPTAGRIEVRGQISTLLALGLGFNPQLSGRENVILGGLASGLSRDEINDKFNDIATFADLGDFIDLPTRTYSSGMGSRLAFSVAVHMDPDILLIDEALSAGDAAFKKKARIKMEELMQSARTMLVVSHGLGTIKELCNDAIWLDHGRLVSRGEPSEIVDAYTKFVDSGNSAVVLEDF